MPIGQNSLQANGGALFVKYGLKISRLFLHSHGALAQGEGGTRRAILMQLTHCYALLSGIEVSYKLTFLNARLASNPPSG